MLVEPDRPELAEQVGIELELSKAHLRSVLAQYWDHDWRRDNRSHTSPEDQLWRAATAVTELEDARSQVRRLIGRHPFEVVGARTDRPPASRALRLDSYAGQSSARVVSDRR